MMPPFYTFPKRCASFPDRRERRPFVRTWFMLYGRLGVIGYPSDHGPPAIDCSDALWG